MSRKDTPLDFQNSLVLGHMLKSFSRLLLSFALFISLGVYQYVQAQYLEVDTASYIEWTDELYLNWKDYRFKNKGKKEAGGMALTSVRHSVRGGIIEDTPRFEVKVLFVKADSWTTDSTDIALLAHEKLHFDIAELYGRKIRKQLDDLFERGERDLKIYNK